MNEIIILILKHGMMVIRGIERPRGEACRDSGAGASVRPNSTPALINEPRNAGRWSMKFQLQCSFNDAVIK